MRDHWADISKDAVLYGVSCDGVEKHAEFIEKFNFPFPLLSDESRDVVRAFGMGVGLDLMKGKLMLAKRLTVIIDADGLVEAVFAPVDKEAHGQEILVKLA